MADRFEFDLVSGRTASSSSKSRRSYSQRNVSSLQHELTRNRKMINVKASTTATFNRTLSFKPLPVTKYNSFKENLCISLSFIFSSSLGNVENTPVKIIPTKKLSFDLDTSGTMSISHEMTEDYESVEETPVKEENDGNEMLPSDIMAREIQRLSLRLRSSAQCKILIREIFLSTSTITRSLKNSEFHTKIPLNSYDNFVLIFKYTMFLLSKTNQINQQLFIFRK